VIRVAAAGALFLAVFFEPISTVVTGWTRRSSSFGIIIFGLFVYMLWARRSALREVPVRAEPGRGSLLLAVACAMLLLGKVGNLIVVQEFAIIVASMGMVWALWGLTMLKNVTFPLSYLAFTFPFFPAFLGKHTLFFQNTSAFLAEQILSLGGMPVSREGELLTLPHVVLDVVRDCSGINHIIALMAISMPMAYFTLKSQWTKVGLVVSSFFIGVFANSVRIALIGVWTSFRPNADIHGPTNLLITSGFIMGFGLILLILAQRLFLVMDRGDAPSRPSVGNQGRTEEKQSRLLSNSFSTVFAVLLLTGLAAHFAVPKPDLTVERLDAFPVTFGDWKGEDVIEVGEPFENQNADMAIRRIYRGPSGNVKIYIGYYLLQTQEKKIFNVGNDILDPGSKAVTVSGPHGSAATILQSRYRGADGRRKAYYWYLVDGRVISDRIRLKLALIRNVLIHRRNSAAIVIVAQNDADASSATENNTFLQTFVQPAIAASGRLLSK
jgi:EpsI family protein